MRDEAAVVVEVGDAAKGARIGAAGDGIEQGADLLPGMDGLRLVVSRPAAIETLRRAA